MRDIRKRRLLREVTEMTNTEKNAARFADMVCQTIQARLNQRYTFEQAAFAKGFKQGCEEGYVAAVSLLSGGGEFERAVLALFRPIKPTFDCHPLAKTRKVTR